MKIKSVLVAVLINFLAISSLFALPPHEYYKPNQDNKWLLERSRGFARMLGYDENKILDAYYVTLPDDILGKTYYKDDGAIILVNRNIKWWDHFEFDENIIHEICHVYTTTDLDWHIAMVKAADKIWHLGPDILRDEATDHPLD